ncbi:MAG TPA: XRE family transcriptional regulator [Kiritimatiellia bacterium]|nr:XRE family transcriptional regulator [Kiritimatiellia bacterium]
MIHSIAQNLRHFRALHGLTQGELADKAGISRNAYRAIETGKAEPRESNLLRIAEALGISPMDLLREVPRLQTLRFRSHKARSVQQRAERDELVTRIAYWLQDFNELEALLADRKPQKIRMGQRRDTNPLRAAEQARLDMGVPQDSPIPDVCDVIEDAGIKLLMIPARSDIFYGLSIGPTDGGPAIVVNARANIPVERRIFSAAHELGHLLLHPGSFNGAIGEEDPEAREETEAHSFASHFLMPQAAFDAKWNEYAGLHFVDRVLKMKRHFFVSYPTVLYRLIDIGATDSSIWAKFRHLYRHRTGKELPPKKQEPYPLAEPDFREDRLELLVRNALEQDLITLDRAAEILGLSIEDLRARVDSWSAAR